MTPDELRARLARFAVDVESATRPLLDRLTSRDAALQLRRASSSVAANHRAAGRGRSHAEFTAKLGVALEEADEAVYWLDYLADTGLIDRREVSKLLVEGRELVAILTASFHTCKARRR